MDDSHYVLTASLDLRATLEVVNIIIIILLSPRDCLSYDDLLVWLERGKNKVMQKRKRMKGQLKVRYQVCSVFSLKMHCINESDNKCLINQNQN